MVIVTSKKLLQGYSYYKKQESRPYPTQLVSKFLIYLHWRINKGNEELQLRFEKVDSQWEISDDQKFRQKRSRIAKSQCIYPQSSKTVFMNKVKKSRLFPAFLCFENRPLIMATMALEFMCLFSGPSHSMCYQTYFYNFESF